VVRVETVWVLVVYYGGTRAVTFGRKFDVKKMDLIELMMTS
jgi:hypothetical protein